MERQAKNGSSSDGYRIHGTLGARLYRIAYEEGRRNLADQEHQLDSMRTKAVSYMALIGSATAFLVSATLNSAAPSFGSYICAAFATVCSAWALFQLVRIVSPGLVPAKGFIFRIDPAAIINRYIESGANASSEAELLRKLSLFYGEYLKDNSRAIEKVQKIYTQVVLFGAGGLLSWTVIVWTFGALG